MTKKVGERKKVPLADRWASDTEFFRKQIKEAVIKTPSPKKVSTKKKSK